MILILLPQHKGEAFFEELYSSGAKVAQLRMHTDLQSTNFLIFCA